MSQKKKLDNIKTEELLKTLIKTYGLDIDILPQDRKKRRLIAKYWLLPLYSIIFPGISIYLFITKHYVMFGFSMLFTIYGMMKMFFGDKFIYWIMKPILKMLLR